MLAIGSVSLRVPMTYAADRCGRRLVFTVVLIVYAAADVAVAVLSSHYIALRLYSIAIGAVARRAP